MYMYTLCVYSLDPVNQDTQARSTTADTPKQVHHRHM